MPQVIGVPKETAAGEKRVATVPEVVEKLIKLGFRVAVEAGAGDAANFSDDAYRAAGAEIVDTAAALWAASDIVFKVRAPSAEEVGADARGRHAYSVSFIWPAQNPELLQQLAAQQGHGAGDGQRAAHLARAEARRALVDGQHRRLPRRHRGGACTSAASSPARSRPRARCRRPRSSSSAPASRVSPRSARPSGLGAIVRANDTRPEVADQVKSLGGEFVAGRLRGGRHRRRRLRQGDERRLPEGAARGVRASRRRTSTSSSPPRSSRASRRRSSSPPRW